MKMIGSVYYPTPAIQGTKLDLSYTPLYIDRQKRPLAKWKETIYITAMFK